jgi:hypothetical protein
LKIKELGFDENSCFNCKHSKDEADELINGVVPCLIQGHCKHLNNQKHVIERDGLGGNPLQFYEAGGLENFEYLTELIYSLSPYDSHKLPTVMFFQQMEGTSDLSAQDFIELLALKTNYIRSSILETRSREIAKAKQKNAIRV